MLRIERTRNGEGRIFRLIGALDGATTRQLERVVSGPAGDGGDVTLDLAELLECDQAGVDSLTVLARRRTRRRRAVGVLLSARRDQGRPGAREPGDADQPLNAKEPPTTWIGGSRESSGQITRTFCASMPFRP